MITVMLTDTHFNNENTLIVNDLFKQCFEIAERTQTKTVFHLGDWFTTRTGQTLHTLVAVLEVLNEAARRNLVIHTIPGNHDKTNLDDERSFLSVFQNHPALRLYEKESRVQISDNLCLNMLPYFLEDGEYPERLEALKKGLKTNKDNFLCTHITLDGAINNDGSKQKNSLIREQFDCFNWVLSGHYHNRNSPWSKAQYIGSPRASNYGEDNNKGFTVIRSDGSLKFIRSVFREYHQIFFDLNNIEHEGFAQDYERALILASEGHKVRAVVVGEKDMMEAFDRRIFTDNGIEFLPRDSGVLNSVKQVEELNTTKFTKKEMIKAFAEFCKLNSIKGQTLAMGLKLMKNY